MGHQLEVVYPRLYHVAVADAWPNLERHGLLSTQALLDLFQVPGPARELIERRHRPQPVKITHPVHGSATIRDQKPLDDKRLRSALVDMAPDAWYGLLTEHVFFWPTKERMLRILNAHAYRSQEQLVVTVDTTDLLNRCAPNILLSPINSGATRPFAAPRGRDTFQTLNAYPLDARVRIYRRARAVAEVLVKDRVGALTDVAICASIWLDGEQVRTIWKRTGTTEA